MPVVHSLWIVVYQKKYPLHKPLEKLAMSMKGLHNRDEIVIDTVYQKGISLVLLLTGGYAPTLAETVTAHASMFEYASRKI